MSRTYGYTRVSHEESVKSGISFAAQEDSILGCCQWKIRTEDPTTVWGGVFQDAAISAKVPFLKRPAGKKLHAMLKRGDHVIVARLDRAFRRVKDCYDTVLVWDSMGVRVHFLDMGLDTGTHVGRMMMGMLAVVAEFEHARICERNREAALRRKNKNIPVGKPPPKIGWKYVGPKGKRRLVSDENDQKVLDLIEEWKDRGNSFYEIFRHLWFNKIQTHAGRLWSLSRIRRGYITRKRQRELEKAAVSQSNDHTPTGGTHT